MFESERIGWPVGLTREISPSSSTRFFFFNGLDGSESSDVRVAPKSDAVVIRLRSGRSA